LVRIFLWPEQQGWESVVLYYNVVTEQAYPVC